MSRPTSFLPRILIVGASGSGKSTIARRVSKKTGGLFIETDSLYWDDEWNLASDTEVLSKIDLENEGWILDGNFDSCWQNVWVKADLVVWLKPHPVKVLLRVFSRNLRWAFTRSEWNHRRMPFAIAYGGVLHSWRALKRKERVYPQRFKETPAVDSIICVSDKDLEELIERF